MQHAAFYIRVSTHSQEELSPDSQKRLLTDYAKSNNLSVSPDHIYIENGISGRKADKRPKFMEMIATAKSKEHPIDVILVWKFSRFARNQEESIVYKSMLRNKYNVDVLSVSEPLAEGPFGSLIERIIEWMDEFYSIRLSGEVTRGMTQKALSGGYQSRPPLGYRIPYHNAVPEIVPDEAEIVRMIFLKYVDEKMSPYAIAKYLNSLGLKTSRGKDFETRSVEYILQNPGYAGDIRWNRTINATNEIRDPSEWIIEPGLHPPIIEKELFLKAQDRFGKARRHKNAQPAEAAKHWLSGVLKCSACGRTLSSCTRKRKTMESSFSFQCYGYLKGKCQHNSYVSEKEIVPAVLDALNSVLALGTAEYELRRPAQAQDTSRLESLKAGLVKLEAKEKRAKEAYLSGIDTIEEYKQNKEALKSERERLENAVSEASPCPFNEEPDTVMFSKIRNAADLLSSDQFTAAEKNTALKSIVDRIVFDRDQMHIDVYYRLSPPEQPH